MTAAELYEIVKDDPEVWGEVLMWAPNICMGVFTDGREMMTYAASELALEGAYARATGCGVRECDGKFWSFDVDDDCVSRFYGGHPTRLAALRAAYRANKETKR